MWDLFKKFLDEESFYRRSSLELLPWQCDPQIVSGEVLWKNRAVKRFSLLPVISAILLLTGCASVSSTAVFYQSTTANSYPPKPANAVIPILTAPPSRPHLEIGRFAFQTTFGYTFAVNSALYNARRAGADAVIMKSCKSWSVPCSYVCLLYTSDAADE